MAMQCSLSFRGGFYFRTAGPDPAIRDVIQYGVVEQDRILRDDADLGVQGCLSDIADILPVNAHRPAGHIIKPEQQPADGRFART